MTTRTPTASAEGFEPLRAEIERIDCALIDLIAQRVSVGRRVAEAKRAAGLPTLDPAQEAAVIRRAAARAREAGLPEEHVRDVFWALIGLTRSAERDG
jgi:chorismate mutase